MKIAQLPKTMDTVLHNITNDDVYFLRLSKFKSKSGTENHQFSSKRANSIALNKLDSYLEDPEVVLIRVIYDSDDA